MLYFCLGVSLQYFPADMAQHIQIQHCILYSEIIFWKLYIEGVCSTLGVLISFGIPYSPQFLFLFFLLAGHLIFM